MLVKRNRRGSNRPETPLPKDALRPRRSAPPRCASAHPTAFQRFYVVAPSTTAPGGYVRRARLRRLRTAEKRAGGSGPQVRTVRRGGAPVPKNGAEVPAADPPPLHRPPAPLCCETARQCDEDG